MSTENCPCGSGEIYPMCCGLFISGQQLPATPEKLMRSRYSAYTQANIDYISKTMTGKAAVNFDPIEAKTWAEHVTWLKLEVVQTQTDGQKGFVEFYAHYTHDHKKYALHELSEFHRENNQWFYVDGSTPAHAHPLDVTKLSRNDPCPCGSNKKFKKCCAHAS